MGVTSIKEYSNEDMNSFLRQNNINDSIIYFIDKDYKKRLLELTKDSGLLKNHLQPLQASYYNKEGNLISFHINCYAPGFPNLDWNHKGAMEVFPPKTQAPVDTLLTLQKQLRLIKSNNRKLPEMGEDFDYFVIVTWAGFLRKQSRGLINAVRENIRLNTDNKKVKIIYVCTDNIFIE